MTDFTQRWPHPILIFGQRQDAEGGEAGMHVIRPRFNLSLALEQDAAVFQAEVYAILRCLHENNQKAYRNSRIYILTGSEAVLGAYKGSKCQI